MTHKGQIDRKKHHATGHSLNVWVFSTSLKVPPKRLDKFKEHKEHTGTVQISDHWLVFDSYWSAYAAWVKENA